MCYYQGDSTITSKTEGEISMVKKKNMYEVISEVLHESLEGGISQEKYKELKAVLYEKKGVEIEEYEWNKIKDFIELKMAVLYEDPEELFQRTFYSLKLNILTADVDRKKRFEQMVLEMLLDELNILQDGKSMKNNSNCKLNVNANKQKEIKGENNMDVTKIETRTEITEIKEISNFSKQQILNAYKNTIQFIDEGLNVSEDEIQDFLIFVDTMKVAMPEELFEKFKSYVYNILAFYDEANRNLEINKNFAQIKIAKDFEEFGVREFRPYIVGGK